MRHSERHNLYQFMYTIKISQSQDCDCATSGHQLKTRSFDSAQSHHNRGWARFKEYISCLLAAKWFNCMATIEAVSVSRIVSKHNMSPVSSLSAKLSENWPFNLFSISGGSLYSKTSDQNRPRDKSCKKGYIWCQVSGQNSFAWQKWCCQQFCTRIKYTAFYGGRQKNPGFHN